MIVQISLSSNHIHFLQSFPNIPFPNSFSYLPFYNCHFLNFFFPMCTSFSFPFLFILYTRYVKSSISSLFYFQFTFFTFPPLVFNLITFDSFTFSIRLFSFRYLFRLFMISTISFFPSAKIIILFPIYKLYCNL